MVQGVQGWCRRCRGACVVQGGTNVVQGCRGACGVGNADTPVSCTAKHQLGCNCNLWVQAQLHLQPQVWPYKHAIVLVPTLVNCNCT